METPSKEQIVSLLEAWIRQRPGLDFRNYCSGWNDPAGRQAYRAEVRSIGRDLQDARTLLRAVELSSITAEELAAGFRAYSGRLTLEPDPKRAGAWRLDYCTGQYWPTEYRRAVCAVLASALWDYYRDDYTAAAEKRGKRPGDYIRAQFRRQFGRGLASRYFN